MELVVYPNSVLSTKCSDVKLGDTSVKDTLEQMAQKLYKWNGVGLAAPQVGITKKLIVVDIREKPSRLYKMINPKIVWKSDEVIESEEGCLSLPLLRETIWRHESVRVEYLDENFEKRNILASDLLAICLQHEIDHLHGKLYIDRLSRSKRSHAVKKFYKLQQGAEKNE